MQVNLIHCPVSAMEPATLWPVLTSGVATLRVPCRTAVPVGSDLVALLLCILALCLPCWHAPPLGKWTPLPVSCSGRGTQHTAWQEKPSSQWIKALPSEGVTLGSWPFSLGMSLPNVPVSSEQDPRNPWIALMSLWAGTQGPKGPYFCIQPSPH